MECEYYGKQKISKIKYPLFIRKNSCNIRCNRTICFKHSKGRSSNKCNAFIRPVSRTSVCKLSTIDKKIRPYVEKLGKKCDYLLSMKQDLVEELHAEMDMESIEHIQNLNAYFVIGFDCQRNEIKRINKERKEKNKQKEESES